LFDETGEKKDKFSTKPADANGPKNYMVTGMAFSPDSTRLAVAQSDNIVFIYKLGLEWGEKKSICNKFLQSNAGVTCLTWPMEQPNELVFGLTDGTVKVGIIRSNKAQKLYSTDSYVTSLCSSPDGHSILSGHVDGSIYRFSFDESGGAAHVRLAMHTCVPQALAWGENIIAGGNDGKIVFYDIEGGVYQLFDYSSDIANLKEFSVCCFNPSGESAVVGAFNRLHVFNLNIRRNLWEEAGIKQIENMYSVTAMSWKQDGSRLCVGTLAGAIDCYDACLRRYRYKGKFEFTYVSLSQVIVKRLSSGTRIVLKSHFQYEIVKINIYQDQYLVAHTPETLLIGDLESCKLSEVPWSGSGSERFIFENPTVCMVYNAGELTLVEYGRNEILGSARTEHVSPHYISCRLNESKSLGDQSGEQENKKIAYLMDFQTIRVLDLATSHTVATVNHDAKVDWLELNPSATKLLYRDKHRQLHLFDLLSQTRSTLLNFCSYVQWVPNSDVVVAQNRDNLCVWYSIDAPERVTIFQIKGDVEDIERAGGRTEVIVDEGINTVSYRLDETLIEFGSSIENKEYEKAVTLLEQLEFSPETEAMWSTLCQLALQDNRLFIAERCCAALGDTAKAMYLRKVNEIADEAEMSGLPDGTQHYRVQAEMAKLEKQFERAEQILLEQGQVEEAMQMYQELHRWDKAIAISESKGKPETEELKTSYLQWLLVTGQEEMAAKLKEKEGDIETAIQLYLQGGLPVRAAALVQSQQYTQTPEMLETIAAALSKSGLHEKAGNFFEKLNMIERALEAYRKGNAYRKAVELARRNFPREVVQLELEWGNWLVSQKQLDAAINHFIEAGQNVKAIEAAIQARQWSKAVQIVETQDDDVASRFFKIIAQHFETTKNYEDAEKYYIKARCPQDAVDMYMRIKKWEKVHKVAVSFMSESAVHTLYVNQGQRLEAQGKLKEAEKLYIMVKEPDLAINMYKKNKHYDQMIRLVSQHRKDLLSETYLHLAQQLEAENKFTEAERHYVDGNDWKSAVNMYRAHDMWDDAIRVAKTHGGENTSKQVAYAWAVSLGGEAGAKLLTKFNLIEQAIDYATESGAFDQAFHLARSSKKEKLPDVHLKHAMYLEDEGRFREAEEEFINAKKPKEAIEMYIHQQDWPNALRIAENHDPNSRSDVMVAKARSHIDKKDLKQAENIFIEVGKVELAVKMYKDARKWDDAIRIAKSHENAPNIGPGMVYELQQEKARGMSAPDAQQDLMAPGKMWEESGDYSKAIDAYLKITSAHTQDLEYLEEIWEKAVELAMNYVHGRIAEVVSEVSHRLVDIGRFEQAAEFLEGIDKHKEAIDVYIKAGMWDNARALGKTAPQLQSYVEEMLKRSSDARGGGGGGGGGGGSSNPAKGAMPVTGMGRTTSGGESIQELAKRGDWERCLQVAKKMGQEAVDQYVALHVASFSAGESMQAVRVLQQHGTPLGSNNVALYKQIARDVLGRGRGKATTEGTWLPPIQELREVLFKIWSAMQAQGNTDAGDQRDVERLLQAAHLLCLQASCRAKGAGMAEVEQKICVSLLRYCDILPADRVFYEAGMACKAAGKLNQAFVLCNRFLDICDAMEESDSSMMENTDFEGTDVPFEFNLQEKPFVPENDREEVRDWVLQLSMDKQVEPVLPTRACVKCNTKNYDASLVCSGCNTKFKPCVVTGYPVMRGRGELPAEEVFVNFHNGSASFQSFIDFTVKGLN